MVSKTRLALAAVGVATVSVIVAGCAPASESKSDAGAVSVVTQTKEVTVNNDADSASDEVADDDSSDEAAAQPTKKANGEKREDRWVMPDMTGENLQDAQDDMQVLTANPAFITLSEDALGQERTQIIDSNWKVCSQTPDAGTSFGPTKTIVFYAVKLDESCP